MATTQRPAWPPPSPETEKDLNSPPLNRSSLSTGSAVDIPIPTFNSRFSQQRYGEFPTINNVACRQQPTVVLKPRNPVHQVCSLNIVLADLPFVLTVKLCEVNVCPLLSFPLVYTYASTHAVPRVRVLHRASMAWSQPLLSRCVITCSNPWNDRSMKLTQC